MDPLSFQTGGTTISHVMFADDIILFGDPTTDQIKTFADFFSKFGKASG